MSVRSFLDERIGLGASWRAFTHRPWPGGPALRHAVFAALVFLFVQQAVLGIVLSAYYSPSVSDAWASTAYLNDQVELGWFIRGLHDHGASAFVVLAVLHLAALAFAGAYRRPRELMWLAAIAVVGLALGEGMTGNPLPWDETGFWAIQVELGIIEQTPGGGAIKRLLQGGSSAGNLTVLRLFVLHAFVLPLAIIGLLAFIARQRRRHGPAAADDAKPDTYAPGQLMIDVLAMTITSAIVATMTVSAHGTDLFAPADPTSGFQARPEWYFLFLYKLRHWFEGSLEPIATVVIPGLSVAFLASAPVLERIAGRAGRIAVLAGLSTLLAGAGLLTAMAMMDDRGDESYQKALAQAEKDSVRARNLAREGVDPRGGGAVYWNDPEFKVKQLYAEHCKSCHALDGVGGGEAPDLTDYSSTEWLSALIRDPNDPRFFGKTKHDTMEAYPADKLTAEQLADTVAFLESLMDTEGKMPDKAAIDRGKALWNDELDCNNCHEIDPGKDNEGPNLYAHGTRAWVVRIIEDSSAKDLFGEKAQMPKFKDKLSAAEIAALAELIVAQR
jgi:ubiquinol-cytochrome c reductase cytochrome b subunit